ncbi:Putative pectate lyase, pectin lyase/virulence factor [Septoria linicola]|uniref:pectin lyase n=1 Tax=Septoria linicola TaxID=215465 RepID=A0A9Q9AMR2_9PEZI|nr:putative pectate lyase, pectin lyase/virulence factor [Septoria linicola]USW52159.1 Putative pectate lyase, pectin lyase/virulence factor [Septoria linicola]
MLSQALLALALVASPLTLAQSVVGEAIGFASGTTGGAAGKTVTPSTTDELVEYLESDDALTIVLTKTFDFTGTEGTTTETGCAPWGTASGCQLAINANDWCGNYQSGAGAVEVTYDNAGTSPIKVKGDKSIIGSGSSGVIKGKGLSLQNDVSNIIIQNIQITDLNPEYVWGGDAITLNGCSNVWVDHVAINLIGRMMIVAGYETNTNIAITNSEFDGQTDWSASCNGEHYWGLFFIGENDQITLKGNYIHHTSGRSPKVGGNTVLHAVNNYFADNSGHAFEGEESYVLLEGSIFDNVKEAEQDFAGSMYTPTKSDSACQSALGRSCAANTYTSSGALEGTDSNVLKQFDGLTIADAEDDASAVPDNAGVGKLSSSSSSKNATKLVRRNVVRRAGQWRM